MKSLAIMPLFALIGSPVSAETCAPAQLIKIVTRSIGPDVAPGSLSAAPVTLYRQGPKHLRLEEAPDPVTRQQRLVVVASPDVWIANLADRTGDHVLDPGPTYEAKAPVITGQGTPEAFTELEYGCEARFALGRAREAGERLIAGRPARVHVMQAGDRRLEVLLFKDGQPAEVNYYRGAAIALAIRYDLYQPGLPDDPALFRKPPGVRFGDGR